MTRVIYSPAAESDFVDIAAYIARDKPDAAFRWVRTIHVARVVHGSRDLKNL